MQHWVKAAVMHHVMNVSKDNRKTIGRCEGEFHHEFHWSTQLYWLVSLLALRQWQWLCCVPWKCLVPFSRLPTRVSQVCRFVDSLHELCSCRDCQSVGDPQPHHIRHNTSQIQAGSSSVELHSQQLKFFDQIVSSAPTTVKKKKKKKDGCSRHNLRCSL